MMAGRAAVGRQGWGPAIEYFTNLTSDLKCPPEVWVQAMFAYGDTLVSMDSTNKPADYKEAWDVFDKIAKVYPANAQTALVWGKKAECLLALAQSAQDYEPVTNAFQQVINSTNADATARSIAKIGLAISLEKMADKKTGTTAQVERAALFNSALSHHLDVLYGNCLRDGEKPDPFWTAKAGIEAARLAEKLNQWPQALNVYRRLLELLPPLRAQLEDKIQRVQRHLPPPQT
jgi:tetratricopeptide (TPR) repeat protein